jgi:hypothetical protein
MTNNSPLSRRTLLGGMTAMAACAALPAAHVQSAEQTTRKTGMGLVIYDCTLRRQWMREQQPDFDLFEPLTFLKHCHSLGAGGMQANLGKLTAEKSRELRDYAQQHELFIDAIISPPQNKEDLPRFEAEIIVAREVGAQSARTTIIPGRRYERFKTLTDFREFGFPGPQSVLFQAQQSCLRAG